MKGKSPQWQWSNKMLEDIIVCLKEYKSEMDFKDVDFNVDVAALYSCYTRFVICTYESEWLSSLTRSILTSVCHFHESSRKKINARLPTEQKYKLTRASPGFDQPASNERQPELVGGELALKRPSFRSGGDAGVNGISAKIVTYRVTKVKRVK